MFFFGATFTGRSGSVSWEVFASAGSLLREFA